MPDYQRSIRIDADASRVFAYVADIDHLPDYLDQMKSVTRTGAERVDVTAVVDIPGQGKTEVENEAWFRADAPSQRIEWGSLGEDTYHGSLDVSPDGDATEVSFAVHTLGHEGSSSDVDASIDAALEHIRTAVGADSV